MTQVNQARVKRRRKSKKEKKRTRWGDLERHAKQTSKKTRETKSSTVCQRGSKKTKQNRRKSLAKSLWDWSSESQRGLYGVWKKTFGESWEFGSGTSSIDGRVENGKYLVFVG